MGKRYIVTYKHFGGATCSNYIEGAPSIEVAERFARRYMDSRGHVFVACSEPFDSKSGRPTISYREDFHDYAIC